MATKKYRRKQISPIHSFDNTWHFEVPTNRIKKLKQIILKIKIMPFNKLLAVLLFHWFLLPMYAQEIKVITYNIKYDNTNDTVNNWNDRKQAMVTLLKNNSADFIGMQEVLANQLHFLNQAMPDYSYIGVGREDGKEKGEFSPIFYDNTKYTLLNSKTFWLSKTPTKISVGWDAALERICTYGLFQNKITKEQTWVFNTHFDHKGTTARKKSVKLILRKIKELNTLKKPVILMGDLNLSPKTKAIQLLKSKIDDAITISEVPNSGPKGTFNGFKPNTPITDRIDYIFTKHFRVKNYNHIDRRLSNNKHISDHLPVFSTLTTK